jgi:hypothetical protein
MCLADALPVALRAAAALARGTTHLGREDAPQTALAARTLQPDSTSVVDTPLTIAARADPDRIGHIEQALVDRPPMHKRAHLEPAPVHDSALATRRAAAFLRAVDRT